MIRASLISNLEKIAKKFRIESALKFLIAEARECIYIFYVDTNSPIDLGASRFGGDPDLPLSIQWPSATEPGTVAMRANFIAQICFSDLPPLQDFPLPAGGHAWLFVTSCPSKGPELGVKLIYEADPSINLRRYTTRGDVDWVLGETAGAVPLRFELGVSLPFGCEAFREALEDAIPKGGPSWEEIAEAILPEATGGQIGGYSCNSRGDDLSRIMGLHRLGRSDLVSGYHWDTIADLERSMSRVPAYIQTPDELRRWKESFGPLRPGVAWIEQHLRELRLWRLLIRLNPNIPAHFCLGDSCPLWVFGRADKLSLGDFDDLAATDSP